MEGRACTALLTRTRSATRLHVRLAHPARLLCPLALPVAAPPPPDTRLPLALPCQLHVPQRWPHRQQAPPATPPPRRPARTHLRALKTAALAPWGRLHPRSHPRLAHCVTQPALRLTVRLRPAATSLRCSTARAGLPPLCPPCGAASGGLRGTRMGGRSTRPRLQTVCHLSCPPPAWATGRSV